MLNLIERYNRSRVDRDSGFTLVELIVAMIVLSIIAAMLATFMLSAMRNSSKSLAQRKAIEQANDTIVKFQEDLRQTKAPGREHFKAGDTQGLGALLLPTADEDDGTVTDDAVLAAQDILIATSTHLRVVADATSEPEGVADTYELECVDYRAEAKGDKRVLYRTIMDYEPFKGAGTQSRCIPGQLDGQSPALKEKLLENEIKQP